MSQPAAKPVPDGMHTITPHIVVAGASDAMALYGKAFGAVEQMRMPGPGGKLMHACVKIGDSMLFLVDESPDWKIYGPNTLKGSPVTLHLQVPDVDALFAQAVAAGCTAVMPPTDMFWGDRYGQVKCPWGHTWAMATHQRDLTPAQIEEEMKKAPPMGG